MQVDSIVVRYMKITVLSGILIFVSMHNTRARMTPPRTEESLIMLQILVTLRNDDKIARFKLVEETGELVRMQDFQIKGGPGPLFMTPDRNQIYVGLRDSNQVGILDVAPNGTLTLKDTSSLGFSPVHLILGPDMKSLWAASYGGNTFAAFRVHADGTVDPNALFRIDGIDKAHQVVYWPQEEWILVPALGLDKVMIYDKQRVVQTSEPKPAYIVSFPKGAGPRHLVWHPSEPRFFVANELHSTVTMVEWKDKSDTFIVHPEVSSLPDNFSGSNSSAQIKISPGGNHLYVSNRGHNSIAVFEILDTETGLRLIDNVTTESRPRCFALNASGRWLVAAGQKSGFIVLYERDRKTGLLTKKDRTYAGKESYWVEIFTPY